MAEAHGRHRPGWLSRAGESGDRIEAASSGAGDPGHNSFGAYQLNSHTVQQFLHSPEGRRWEPDFRGHHPSDRGFQAAWERVARDEGESLTDAEQRFIERTHVRPQEQRVQRETGIDVTERSEALREVVWSRAVQHGPDSEVVVRGIRRAKHEENKPIGDLTDAEMIHGIYEEAGKRDAHGNLAYFSDSSAAVQRGVAGRLRHEAHAAQGALHDEQQRAAHAPQGEGHHLLKGHVSYTKGVDDQSVLEMQQPTFDEHQQDARPLQGQSTSNGASEDLTSKGPVQATPARGVPASDVTTLTDSAVDTVQQIMPVVGTAARTARYEDLEEETQDDAQDTHKKHKKGPQRKQNGVADFLPGAQSGGH